MLSVIYSTTTDTTMGAIGLAVTGGVFYNQLSSTDGSLALTNEGTSLDSCFGHSDLVKKKKICIDTHIKINVKHYLKFWEIL